MNNLSFLISLIFIYIILTISYTCSQNADQDRLQAVHVLNPEISNFSSYSRWNSDEWINWLRLRFASNLDGSRRNEGDGDDKPSLGKWVNIILVTNEDELYSAFEETSTKAYPGDESRSEYLWSNTAFPVYVVIRNKPPPPVSDDMVEDTQPETQYTVYNCGDKPMFINAKIDPATHKPIFIQTIFPKRVKNPKNTLRIPLTVCKKVRKVGLLDEINLLFRSQ